MSEQAITGKLENGQWTVTISHKHGAWHKRVYRTYFGARLVDVLGTIREDLLDDDTDMLRDRNVEDSLHGH